MVSISLYVANQDELNGVINKLNNIAGVMTVRRSAG
jgi:(p)ppGpp synthase/HD superfamily hydrolase